MAETRDIMTRLKEDTRGLHDAAEQQDYMRELMSGTLSKDRFLEALQQLYLLHVGLEERLATLRTKSPIAAGLVKDYHFATAEAARQDLKDLGLSADGIEANEGVREFHARMDHWLATDPDAALGMFYVIEGSNNGGKILKNKLAELFALEGDSGVRHQDPHGAEMRPRWMAFVMAMKETPFSETTKDDIVSAANDAFRTVGLLYKGVAAQVA